MPANLDLYPANDRLLQYLVQMTEEGAAQDVSVILVVNGALVFGRVIKAAEFFAATETSKSLHDAVMSAPDQPFPEMTPDEKILARQHIHLGDTRLQVGQATINLHGNNAVRFRLSEISGFAFGKAELGNPTK